MRRFPVRRPQPFHASGILLSMAVATVAVSAHAQPAGGALTSTLWEEAFEAMHKQDYASACLKIEAVTRLQPDELGAKLTLAECYEGAGRLASAWATYALVEPLAEKANQPELQKTAHDRAEALKPKLATLTIVVPETVRARLGLEIRCDDRVVEPAQWGIPLPVDRGRHVIVSTAIVRGEQPEVIEADGATRTVTIIQPASVTPPSAVTPPVFSKRSVAPAVVLGLLAAGGIATGIGFTVAASSKDAEAAAVGTALTAQHGACVTTWGSYKPKACADLKQKLDARNRFQDVAVGAFIGGGAVAVGTMLYLLWPAPHDKTTGPSVARDIRLAPILSPTSGELLVSGSF